MSIPRPPYDPDVQAALARRPVGDFAPLAPAGIAERRATVIATYEEQFAGESVQRQDRTISGHHGDPIEVSVLSRANHTDPKAGIVYIHGGGMVVGNRFSTLDRLKKWILHDDAVVVTVEYRLAPEYPDPTPVEDAYAALSWAGEHAQELGFDPARLVVLGISAGGGIAAGAVLLARDRGGPSIAGQMLLCPMLDDRDASVSSQQFEGLAPWNRESNRTGWSALLGERRGTEDVSIYAAPARAHDLSHLPPTYLDCGTAEVFRDECVDFATRMWAAGGQLELHIWDGGCHGFDVIAPEARISLGAVLARDAWMTPLLAPHFCRPDLSAGPEERSGALPALQRDRPSPR